MNVEEIKKCAPFKTVLRLSNSSNFDEKLRDKIVTYVGYDSQVNLVYVRTNECMDRFRCCDLAFVEGIHYPEQLCAMVYFLDAEGFIHVVEEFSEAERKCQEAGMRRLVNMDFSRKEFSYKVK